MDAPSKTHTHTPQEPGELLMFFKLYQKKKKPEAQQNTSFAAPGDAFVSFNLPKCFVTRFIPPEAAVLEMFCGCTPG